jgi:hypothetical protein
MGPLYSPAHIIFKILSCPFVGFETPITLTAAYGYDDFAPVCLPVRFSPRWDIETPRANIGRITENNMKRTNYGGRRTKFDTS